MWTAQEGHTEVAKLLLERGADITIKDQVYNYYVSYIANPFPFSIAWGC